MKCEFCNHELSHVVQGYVEMYFCKNKVCSYSDNAAYYMNTIVKPPKSATKIVITSTPSGESEVYKAYKESVLWPTKKLNI